MTGIMQTGGSNGPMAGGGLFSPAAVQTSAYNATATKWFYEGSNLGM
jgi:hypothetical protein